MKRLMIIVGPYNKSSWWRGHFINNSLISTRHFEVEGGDIVLLVDSRKGLDRDKETPLEDLKEFVGNFVTEHFEYGKLERLIISTVDLSIPGSQNMAHHEFNRLVEKLNISNQTAKDDKILDDELGRVLAGLIQKD